MEHRLSKPRVCNSEPNRPRISMILREVSPLAPLGILATAPQTFIRFRELISARGHALLQLFLPIDHDVDLLGSPVGNVRQRRHDETPTVGRDVVRRRIT